MTQTPTPTITGIIVRQDGSDLSVWPVWTAPGIEGDLNRSGYAVKDRKMADRLAKAIMAGAVYYDESVKYDVNGDPYVSASSRVLGRTMNADLRRLGF